VAAVEPSATIPIFDAGVGLICLLFPKTIVLSVDQLTGLVKRPD